MRQLLDIFIASFKVGLMTFGGGYAMLPILQREVVESRKWVTEEEVLDFYAIGQCLPGIIMVDRNAEGHWAVSSPHSARFVRHLSS